MAKRSFRAAYPLRRRGPRTRSEVAAGLSLRRFHRRRRPVAVALGVALLPMLSGCTSKRTVDTGLPTGPAFRAEQALRSEKIVGVTTSDGTYIEFDEPGTLANDTIRAQVESQPGAWAIADLDRIWVRDTARSFSAVKTIGLVVGVTLGAALVAALIVAATKESCPFIYTWDGTRYVFDAEPYGGAISRGLERDDYSELEHLVPDEHGVYRLIITNEVFETQHTNFMELLVVDHAAGARVAFDASGRAYGLTDPRPPKRAVTDEGRDLLGWLERTDRVIWEPMPAPPGQPQSEEILLTFDKPEGAKTAYLLANAATGLWGSHMKREFLLLLGPSLDDWYASVDTDPAVNRQLGTWATSQQLFWLSITVEEPTGWEERGSLVGGGPFVAEDRVVPVDVSRAVGPELRLRLRPTRGFWALNSFAVDYAAAGDVRVSSSAPIRADDADGADVLSSIAAVDDAYYVMPRTGDYGFVDFPAPPATPGYERTVFLHTRGYYRQHIEPAAEGDALLLGRILTEDGAAAAFSAERYASWRKDR